MRKYLFRVLMVSFLISQSLATREALAKTSQEYVDEAYLLIGQQEFDKALTLLQEAYQNNPGNPGLIFAMSECYHNLKDYETAIANYLQLLNTFEAEARPVPGELHYNLVDAYNELGQKHYFSPELCLRIIYHTEKAFELMPEIASGKDYMEFLRKTIGHYDVASMGTGNVKMMETGGDGLEFNLPEDNISQERKIVYLSKAKNRVDNFDSEERKELYQIAKSDRTVQNIIDIFEKKVKKINSAYFEKIISNKVVEEIYYCFPDKFKAVTLDAISIINGNKYYIIEKKTGKIVEEQELNLFDTEPLKSLLVPNLKWISKYYDLEVEKFTRIPDFLAEFYSQGSGDNLYLLNARLKKKDQCPFYPPIVRIEYFIDSDLELAVCIRNYWLGILGSGKEDELASETVISAVQKSGAQGLYLPKSGTTTGRVEELAGLNELWSIEVISLGKYISKNEFNLNQYKR